ncbi:MAG: hypothetical protein NVSMB21_09510 [Vulcanimicrobiaceae bacterium]
MTTSAQPFLTDVTELRRRAREKIEDGAITPAYGGDPEKTIDILQSVLATEEEHANDMHDLLVAHEGRPFIEK